MPYYVFKLVYLRIRLVLMELSKKLDYGGFFCTRNLKIEIDFFFPVKSCNPFWQNQAPLSGICGKVKGIFKNWLGKKIVLVEQMFVWRLRNLTVYYNKLVYSTIS